MVSDLGLIATRFEVIRIGNAALQDLTLKHLNLPSITRSAILAAMLFIPLTIAAFVLVAPHGPLGGSYAFYLGLLIALPAVFIFITIVPEHFYLGLAFAAVAEFGWVFFISLVISRLRGR